MSFRRGPDGKPVEIESSFVKSDDRPTQSTPDEGTKQPQGMLVGFQKFRKNTNFQHEVINTLDNRILEKGEVYLVLDDQNLIVLIKKMRDQRLVLGKDIGIISYNETLLKEIVEGGITTISTDFKEMGKRLAQMIINRERFLIENPNDLIIRNSL